MDFQFSPEENQFRMDVRRFLLEEVGKEELYILSFTEDVPPKRRMLKRLAEKGWLAMTWPKEYGGLGMSGMYRLIFLEEMGYCGGPTGGLMAGARLIGPTLMLYGSDEQKKEFLPRIAAGDIEFALGYSESNAGSDLASLRISAVDDGDHYTINGEKMFSTASHFSDYHWLAARTDPNQPKHKGVSLFMVDLKSPGISINPLWSIAGEHRTNVVNYDNVRVPKANLVGEANRGFQYIAAALSFERMFVVGQEIRLLEDLIRYAKTTRRGGKLIVEHEWARRGLAKAAVKLRVGRLMSHWVAWIQAAGGVPSREASQAKLYITEMKRDLADLAMRLLGHFGELDQGAPHSPLEEAIGRTYMEGIIMTIVGGTSEIQRNIIAQRGLGLPR